MALILVIFTLSQPFLLRAEEVSLTLDEAVVLALRNNRDVLLKAEEVKKAKLKIAEACASFFPTLDFTGNWTNTRGLYLKDIASTTTQTTLKQYLYKGSKTINTIEQNEYKLAVAQALWDKTKLETVLNVKKAFYTLLLTQEFLNLNKRIVENIQEHLTVIKERYQNGQASESDLLEIEASLHSVWEAYEVSLNQLEASQVLLNNILYLDIDTKIKPDAQFSYEPIEIAYAEALLQALALRPEIRQFEAQEKVNKKAIEIAKADSRPNIYASWDYYSRSTTSLTFSPTKGWQDYNIIGVTFTWPIFDGWLTKAKVEQAIVDLKETQVMKEKTIKDIALELKNVYISLKNAIAKLKATDSELLLYKNNLLTVEEKYRQGEVSLLDKKDANLKYNISIFNKKEAIYDYLIAKSSFDKATGGL